jgi:hypothetical protein
MKSGERTVKKRYIGIIIAVSSFLLVSMPVFASQAVKDKLYGNNGQRNICGAVKTTIEQGMNNRDVVRTAIELGNSPCLVVKCAIYGGGDLKQIISGAMEAGATSDVVSRCAIDAGANSREVSASLLQAGISLCYFEPEGLPYTPPGDNPAPLDPIPKPNPDPPISPSTF